MSMYDKVKAFEIYKSLLKFFENDPFLYDKASNIAIHNFNFAKKNDDKVKGNDDYIEATLHLRNGELNKAIGLYKKAIHFDKYCYPAYLGISQALYEKQFGTRIIRNYFEIDGIDKLFINYEQMNNNEKNIINASVSILPNFVKKLAEEGSHFAIVPVDAKLTDFPANKHLEKLNYFDDMPFCTLRGIGGENAYVGIERVRDLLWSIPIKYKFTPGCIAHEFAHLVWCRLDSDILDMVKKYYIQAKNNGDFISNYSSFSAEEFFAEYYAYCIRLKVENDIIETGNNDPMVKIICDLKNIKA